VKIVDANVLLYAVNEGSSHHAAARRWLDAALGGHETVGFAWIAILAFLRLATHPRVFPAPLTIPDAASIVEAWLSQRTAVVVEPTQRHLTTLARLLEGTGSAGNLVNDAHVAALAIDHGAAVASFDADFARFPGLRRIDPSED
jgi:toxin-antitoxin system PIN domain toxin